MDVNISAEPTVPNVPGSPRSRFDDLSELLDWLAKRAAPITAAILGIASLMWVDFRRTYGLPVGFGSGSALTSLSAMVAVVCVLLLMLSTAVIFPAQFLVSPLQPGIPRLIDLAIGAEPRHKQARRYLFTYWAACAIVAAGQWAAAVAWMVIHPQQHPLWPIGAVALAVLAQAAVGIWVVRRIHDGPVRPNWLTGLSLSWSLGYQAYLGFAALYGALQFASGDSFKDLAPVCVAIVFVMCTVSLAQLVFARRVVHGWYPNLLKHAFCFTIGLAAFAALIPPAGGFLASYALLSTATPLKQCTILRLSPDLSDANTDALLAKRGDTLTKPLHFVFPADGTYYVKETWKDPTYMIDSKRISSTQSCEASANAPPPNDTAAPKHAG